jgi:phosphate starvation-inducible protein PhoH
MAVIGKLMLSVSRAMSQLSRSGVANARALHERPVVEAV